MRTLHLCAHTSTVVLTSSSLTRAHTHTAHLLGLDLLPHLHNVLLAAQALLRGAVPHPAELLLQLQARLLQALQALLE